MCDAITKLYLTSLAQPDPSACARSGLAAGCARLVTAEPDLVDGRGQKCSRLECNNWLSRG